MKKNVWFKKKLSKKCKIEKLIIDVRIRADCIVSAQRKIGESRAQSATATLLIHRIAKKKRKIPDPPLEFAFPNHDYLQLHAIRYRWDTDEQQRRDAPLRNPIFRGFRGKNSPRFTRSQRPITNFYIARGGQPISMIHFVITARQSYDSRSFSLRRRVSSLGDAIVSSWYIAYLYIHVCCVRVAWMNFKGAKSSAMACMTDARGPRRWKTLIWVRVSWRVPIMHGCRFADNSCSKEYLVFQNS